MAAQTKVMGYLPNDQPPFGQLATACFTTCFDHVPSNSPLRPSHAL